MTSATAMRDALESLVVIAVGGMTWSVVTKLRRGEIQVVRCEHCGATTSNAYPNCKHCHLPRPGTD